MRILRLVAAIAALALCAGAASAQTRTITFLPQITISASKTGVVEEVVMVPRDARALTVQARFLYGSGGTTAKAWVQTSFDGGLTWVDVMAFAFTTSAATKVSSVRCDTAVAAAYAPTDATLTDDTIKDGLLGDRVRVKWTTTGTYAGATSLKLTGVFQ